jgi:anti-anti-sigma factor
MTDRSLTIDIDDGIAKLTGSLDTGTVDSAQNELAGALEQVAGSDFVLDLANLVYISSAGLRVLLLINKASNQKNVTLKLRSLQPNVQEVFDMVGFNDLFTIE